MAPEHPPRSAAEEPAPQRYRDRTHAARLLAHRLSHLRGTRPLILAVPRGGLPMGRILADELDGELDVVLAHKLGAPGRPELAVGAIDESGRIHLHPAAHALGIDSQTIRVEADRQLAALRARRDQVRKLRPTADPSGRTVVVVDDGAATGETLLAALALLRSRGPSRLIAALGVAPEDTLQRLQAVADEVVCPLTPANMFAVGQFFEDFSQVGDEEALRNLTAPRAPIR